MINVKDVLAKNSIAAVLVGLALTGCGGGKGIVTDVKFDNTVVNGDQYFGLDATLASGGILLPNTTLPIYNPNNPAQILGEIHTDGLHIVAKVNASEALSLPDLVDGTTLPNGAEIPLTLPKGLNPVGIPAINSNSRVYVAVSGKQIMLGVAVAIAKEDTVKLPISIFLPFTISPEIRGTGGFFLGEKQGVAVFALRESLAVPSGTTGPEHSVLAGLPSRAGRIEVREEKITRSKIRRLQKTWSSLRDVQID